MSEKPEDVCVRPDEIPSGPISPLASPIYPASVWRCSDTTQAEQLLSGELAGYVYQRDGHPNADMLRQKLQLLHRAGGAAVTSSGMAAMSLALLSQLECGDHVVLSRQLYGKSLTLVEGEMARFGVNSTLVDTGDLKATAAAFTKQTRLLIVETIANPLLRVADIEALSTLAHARGASLLVDNTFAGPTICRPLEWGADLVLESLSKIMNGHSDVMMGFLGGADRLWDRVPLVLSSWGLASSPFDCWLAARGLATLPLRAARASENALLVARFLAQQPGVVRVEYPGLKNHPEHDLAARQFANQFGWMVAFQLEGGRQAADQFIRGAASIPFCPSLGELCTTLSHPESTSHRSMPPKQRQALGITGGTIRLSVGIDAIDTILAGLAAGLANLA